MNIGPKSIKICSREIIGPFCVTDRAADAPMMVLAGTKDHLFDFLDGKGSPKIVILEFLNIQNENKSKLFNKDWLRYPLRMLPGSGVEQS